MRKVAVLGVGMSKFGKHPNRSLVDLFAEAFFEAFESSNIELKDIEAIYYGNFVGEMTDGSANLAGFMADEVGLKGIPAIRFEGACASSSVAFREAVKAVAAGHYDCVAVGGSERLLSAGTAIGTRALATAVDGVYEITAGLTFPGVFALAARLYSKVYEVPLEKLKEAMAYVSIKNHKNGAANPKGQFYGKYGNLKVEDVLNSRMICSPITLLDCCPMTDGGAAAIVASADLAEKVIDDPIYVLGTGQASAGSLFRQGKEMVKALSRKRSAEMAFKEAKLTPKDVDFVELHDCFTIAEIIALEAMGFFEYGEAWKATLDGATSLDGELPVNPDGGLIGKGHPVGATGVSQVYTVVKQLRGKADCNQLKNVETAMTDTLGGDFTTLVNIILSIHKR
ncbi:MAG: 3-ketoacyl-CoA thiolase [Archaeoglobaceae archaeon]|nr:3-ketoacyl-CoA thiolase [Archaeoglobaceae archaeon]MCX8152309.1 3-ketoacyl-CoA thiolase [Archaeoglobaceae archaeon]MDW8013987.1 beta-ketoacyl synthase N-terminal-like domain-containing protein [Archaeoglobaceae archaeon]